MKPRSYSSEGIVLSRKNYSEADRILIIYSKYHGKTSLLAKGVRKPKSKKRGSLEIFSHIKFSAVKGKGIDLITESELIDSFSGVRQDLRKVSLAYYFMEVVARLTRDEEKNDELFNLIIEYLNRLRLDVNLRTLRQDFIYQILTLLGFWPRGKILENPDEILESITERKINSVRVGKKVLS